MMVEKTDFQHNTTVSAQLVGETLWQCPLALCGHPCSCGGRNPSHPQPLTDKDRHRLWLFDHINELGTVAILAQRFVDIPTWGTKKAHWVATKGLLLAALSELDPHQWDHIFEAADQGEIPVRKLETSTESGVGE